jgi:hypothetical protein
VSSEKKAVYVDMTGTSVAIAVTGIITGVATALDDELAIGDVLVVGGSRYTVVTAATDATGTSSIVHPAPAVAIAATAGFHREVETYTQNGGTRARYHKLETCWQPPLGIFDINTPLPAGDYDLVLTPNTSNYNSAAIQVGSGAIGAKNITLEHMYFNVNVIEAENVPADFTHFLDLHETSVQLKNLTSGTSTEQTFDYTVPPTTYAMSTAVQEIGAGSNPLYPPTQFTSVSNEERNLNRIRLSYAGQVQPSPDFVLEYATSGQDYLTKLYTHMAMESGAFRTGSSSLHEDKDTWVARGPLSHFKFSKPAGDGSTRVDLAIQCNTTTSKVMLFSHYTNVAEITYRNHRAESVNLSYA